MEIRVQKYGGSSLATDRQVVRVAGRVAQSYRQGAQVIVVVSARGDTTDELVRAAEAVSSGPDPHETDKLLATGENGSAALLAIALRDLGVPAVSLTGPEAGMRATGRPGVGTVSHVDAAPVRRWLSRRHVVVVAGFQARDELGAVITLGRGGSDTSAVALAIAHDVSLCEIYTDVDGVRSADPRIVTDPALLDELDAEVMAEMAFSGARVLHSRAVELAAAHGVDILVADSAGRGHGSTIIGRRTGMLDTSAETVPRPAPGGYENRAGVAAVTHDRSVAQLVVRAGGEPAARVAGVLDVLALRQIAVGSVVWRPVGEDELQLTCSVPEVAAAEALSAVNGVVVPDGGSAWVRRSVGAVSVVGIGLLSRPGLTALAMRTLVDAGVDAECVSCTQARTTFLVEAEQVPAAVAALHEQFELNQEPDEEDTRATA
ncbi:aspartate kinase [Actinophytocola oryzae]|uniref:Aspartokinase n=1 Tax=Actinophytocola oryzae TaxID=502181 RepID=A0A4R7VWB4_9PSEU|nr:aspartate kinase [Actinophytocola oryzae]TDV54234.1 aspartate kinase [Actinophytocola oryzae]